MAIWRTTRSGSRRTRSMHNNPSLKSADLTSMPSASTNVRLNCRAAIPRWMYCARLVVLLAATNGQLVVFQHDLQLIALEASNCQGNAQPLRLFHGRVSLPSRRPKCARYCRADSRRRPCRRGRSAVPYPQSPTAAGLKAATSASWQSPPRSGLGTLQQRLRTQSRRPLPPAPSRALVVFMRRIWCSGTQLQASESRGGQGDVRWRLARADLDRGWRPGGWLCQRIDRVRYRPDGTAYLAAGAWSPL